jgi:hypothetical protein
VDVPDDDNASQDDDTTQPKLQHADISRVSPPPALSEEGSQGDDVDRRQEGRKPGNRGSRPPARTSTPVYSVDGSVDDDDDDTSGVAPRGFPASERRTPLLSMDGSLDGSMSMPEDDLLTYSSSMVGGSASFTAAGGSGTGGDKENAFATFAASMREASELAAPSALKKTHSRDRISIVEAKQHGSPSLGGGLRESSPTVVGSIPVKGTQGSRRQKHSRSIPRSPKVRGQKLASNLLLDDFDAENSEVDFEVEGSMFLSKSDFYMSEEDDLSTAAER